MTVAPGPTRARPFVLACTDFSPCSEIALRRAAEIVKDRGARAFLLHVYDPRKLRRFGGRGDNESMEELRTLRQRYFQELEDSDVPYNAVASTDPIQAICRVANEIGAELIVMGSHGRKGVLRQLLGSVAENTVRHASCSVLVVRDNTEPRPG